jgi:type VI secretion system protein ImpA
MGELQLMRPISEESPCGIDLRDDHSVTSVYRKIKDARMDARDAERLFYKGEDSDRSRVHWEEVYALGTDILSAQSKDIEVLSWVIEALLRIKGFKGLSEGFSLTEAAVSTYGDALFPNDSDDESGIWKLQALTGLNGDEIDGSLIVPISNVSLVEGSHLPMWKLQQSTTESELQSCQKILDEASNESLLAHHTALNNAIDAYSRMVTALDVSFMERSPPSSKIKNALSTYALQLSGILADRNIPVVASVSDVADTHVMTQPEIISGSVNMTRQEALSQIKEIADFFTRREPHSPVPYLLKRSIAWANMSFPELLAQMINNGSELQQVYALTGIQSPDAPL